MILDADGRAVDARYLEPFSERVPGASDARDGRRRVAVVFEDITARNRAEDARRESEERLRVLYDAVGERRPTPPTSAAWPCPAPSGLRACVGHTMREGTRTSP